MQPAGLAAVESAKKDERWARAYAGSATIEVPEHLAKALEGCKEAQRSFEALSKTERYGVLTKLQIAGEKGSDKKIEGIVAMLAKGTVIDSPAVVKKETDAEFSSGKNKKITGKRKAEEVEESKAPPRRAGLPNGHDG
jgi:hypothetical protein